MKHETRIPSHRPLLAIEWIPQDRMADVIKVHPYLVPATGQKFNFQ